MPQGFIVTKWTEDEGLILELKFPDTIKVDLDDQMRIFYSHITGTGESGNVVVRLVKSRATVTSYFTGMDFEPPRLINIMLDLDETPELFGDLIIQEINETILSHLLKMEQNRSERFAIEENLKTYLNTTLFYLDRFKSLSREQRMAQIYSSAKRLNVLELLRTRARARNELRYHLEKKLGEMIVNIDLILDPFIKTGIVKQDWIADVNEIYLFLLSDFELIRKPVTKVVEQAKNNQPTKEVANAYLQAIREFFSSYKPSLEDSYKIARNLLHPDKYDLITLFKERIFPLKKIPKGAGQGSISMTDLIKAMENDQVLKVFKDSRKIEWVLLLTDITAESFYPEYLVERIRQDHLEEKLNKEVAVKHLELLESAFKKEED